MKKTVKTVKPILKDYPLIVGGRALEKCRRSMKAVDLRWRKRRLEMHQKAKACGAAYRGYDYRKGY